MEAAMEDLFVKTVLLSCLLERMPKFSLTGILLFFLFRLCAPACDIIMCIPLVISAHNFPILKKYVLQHRYASAL